MKLDSSAFWSAALGSTVTTLWFVGIGMWSAHSDANQRAQAEAAAAVASQEERAARTAKLEEATRQEQAEIAEAEKRAAIQRKERAQRMVSRCVVELKGAIILAPEGMVACQLPIGAAIPDGFVADMVGRPEK